MLLWRRLPNSELSVWLRMTRVVPPSNKIPLMYCNCLCLRQLSRALDLIILGRPASFISAARSDKDGSSSYGSPWPLLPCPASFLKTVHVARGLRIHRQFHLSRCLQNNPGPYATFTYNLSGLTCSGTSHSLLPKEPGTVVWGLGVSGSA